MTRANTDIFKKAKIASNGNIKLGRKMGTWSKLMGNDNYYVDRLGCSVCGSCGVHCLGCKKECYVKASYRYGSVIYGHALRTLAMRENIERLEESLKKQLSRKKTPFEYIRINQSGELETVREFEMWVNLANDEPRTEFYLYTKAFDLIIPYILTHKLPKNLTVLISVWHEYGITEFNMLRDIPNIKAFVYLDGFDYESYGLNITTKCKAYNGRKLDHNITCDKCQKCMNRLASCKVIGCDAH